MPVVEILNRNNELVLLDVEIIDVGKDGYKEIDKLLKEAYQEVFPDEPLPKDIGKWWREFDPDNFDPFFFNFMEGWAGENPEEAELGMLDIYEGDLATDEELEIREFFHKSKNFKQFLNYLDEAGYSPTPHVEAYFENADYYLGEMIKTAKKKK
jgi:hypothetical protein